MEFKNRADIRIGVIGYGASFMMGRTHLTQAREAGGMTPTAICDIDPERTKAGAEDFPGIKTYSNATDMLADDACDVVVVITPHNSHYELAMQALKAGKNVITEKPFTITTEECTAIIEEAKKQGVLLSTYHNRHWDGHILTAVQKVLKEKVIGDVYKVNANMACYKNPGDWWRTSRTISGGNTYDWGVHILEYTLQIMNAGIDEVSGYKHAGYWNDKTVWKDDTNDDEGFIVVRYDNGTYSTLTISQLDGGPKPALMCITGTEGTYLMDFKGYKIIKHIGGEKITMEGENMPTDWAAYYKNVSDALMGEDKLIVTGEFARRPIHILDLAAKSAAAGHAMKAQYK